VKVTGNDAVKVLDFGLAKAIEGDASSLDIANSPTISRMATQAGILLGTAAYMAPEQAKGKPVDRRADIWAFGCVLYEMLTGKQAFTGETVTDTLAAVLTKDPDWSQLPSHTPARVRVLLQRCLQKDAKASPSHWRCTHLARRSSLRRAGAITGCRTSPRTSLAPHVAMGRRGSFDGCSYDHTVGFLEAASHRRTSKPVRSPSA
jgi:serine/threonine protein kinase